VREWLASVLTVLYISVFVREWLVSILTVPYISVFVRDCLISALTGLHISVFVSLWPISAFNVGGVSGYLLDRLPLSLQVSYHASYEEFLCVYECPSWEFIAVGMAVNCSSAVTLCT
jgi:hypothetical protein